MNFAETMAIHSGTKPENIFSVNLHLWYLEQSKDHFKAS